VDLGIEGRRIPENCRIVQGMLGSASGRVFRGERRDNISIRTRFSPALFVSTNPPEAIPMILHRRSS
jgi:hypothetical protein